MATPFSGYDYERDTYGTNFSGRVDKSSRAVAQVRSSGGGFFSQVGAFVSGQFEDAKEFFDPTREHYEKYKAKPSLLTIYEGFQDIFKKDEVKYKSRPITSAGDIERDESVYDEILSEEERDGVVQDEVFRSRLNQEIYGDEDGKNKKGVDAVGNYNFNVTKEKNIVDTLTEQANTYQSPAIINTLAQHRQAQAYIPSTLRSRGSTGSL